MSQSGLTGDDMGLPLTQKTMAEYLQEIGYKTALIGKWHQGNADRFHPTKRGFDEFYGFRGGARSYFAFDAQNPVSRPEDRLERGMGNFEEATSYLTDALAEETIAFIKRNQNSPFFAFLSLTAVHTPMEAKAEDLAQFSHLTGKRQQLAAMTLSMDREIGRVLSTLDDLGLRQNTLVVFTNDNGGPSDTNVSDNSPLSGTKANHLEGGIRVPFIMHWPKRKVTKGTFEHPISTLDLLPTFYAAAGGSESNLDAIYGLNLLPFINKKKSGPVHSNLYWKKESRAAIRQGQWKLLRFPDRPAKLYDLNNDISETNDVAARHPELVRRLYKQLFNWELSLERPLWQLKREYEGAAMRRMDNYHQARNKENN